MSDRDELEALIRKVDSIERQDAVILTLLTEQIMQIAPTVLQRLDTVDATLAEILRRLP